jgi:hypothetical protein
MRMSIKGQWLEFLAAIPGAARFRADQVEDLRRVFYAGAYALLEIQDRISESEVTDDQGLVIYIRLHAELDAFMEELRATTCVRDSA